MDAQSPTPTRLAWGASPGAALAAGWRPDEGQAGRWQPLRLACWKDLTPTVRELELEPLGGTAPGFEPGAHLPLRWQHEGRVFERHYSLIPPAPGTHDAGRLRIAVKRLDNGRGGSRALHALERGATLQMQPPRAHFALDTQAAHVLLIAGGIGVTPLLSMAEALARRPGARGTLTMHYTARGAAELAYRGRLEAALGAALRCHDSLSGERLDLDAAIAALPPAAQCYACGPASLLDALRAAWARAARPASALRFESFGSSGRLPNRRFVVRLARHGGREIEVDAHSSLLDALERAGIAVLADCRHGACGLCALDVVGCEGGELDHRDVFLSPAQKAAGRTICACVSRASGGTLTLDTAWRGAPR
jgi:vanillate O-demethylase ferredoxin subunit